MNVRLTYGSENLCGGVVWVINMHVIQLQIRYHESKMGSGVDGKGNTGLVLAASNQLLMIAARLKSFSESSLSDAGPVLPGT